MRFGSSNINSLIPSAANIKAALESLAEGLAASAIRLVTTSMKVVPVASLQAWAEAVDTALLNARSSGIRYGGISSVVGGIGVGTTVSITAGAGQLLNNADASNPTYTAVSWTAKTGLAIANTTTSQTWWYVDDASDTIKQQTTKPTRSERRSRLYLFRTSFTNGVISALESEASPVQQASLATRDLGEALGTLRAGRSDLTPSKGGGALKLAMTGGGLFKFGSNYPFSYLDPNVVTFDAFDSAGTGRFRYAIPAGPLAPDLSDIQVGNYAPNGAVAAIPGSTSRVGLHFIFRFPGGNTRIVYGDQYYNNLDEAVVALGSIDPFALAPASFETSGFVVGAIAATAGTTDLTTARFVRTNQFGNFSGGVVSQSGALLRSNNLSDVASPATACSNLGVYGARSIIAHREFGNLQAVASGANDVTVVDFTLPALQSGDTVHIAMYAQGGGTMSASGGLWLRWIRDGVTSLDLYTLFNATINTVGVQRYIKVRDADFWLAVLGDTNLGSNATAPTTGAINRASTQKIQVVFRSQNLTTTLHNLVITVWRDTP
ncbi:hypothetical protein [Leptolyngbya sp. FACHB-16]|uniref:hypothetical protein n=1 Tax=unclassified Leptolyngbya TaxID=2650499 RepID=UPI0016855D72|nr:hypothetical protein [Leptolyngbya sp. FACHB-16]MBD2156234.1 hypothetical protein [Leptolyngbya sp. FACHB-16]